MTRKFLFISLSLKLRFKIYSFGFQSDQAQQLSIWWKDNRVLQVLDMKTCKPLNHKRQSRDKISKYFHYDHHHDDLVLNQKEILYIIYLLLREQDQCIE